MKLPARKVAAPDCQLNFEEVAAVIPTLATQAALDAISQLLPAVVTSLPGSPVEGQEVYYRAAAGVLWHLRRTSAGWEYVGGPPLRAFVAGSSGRTSATYGDLDAGAGPSLTVPLAGDYDVSFGARELSCDTSGQPAYMNVGTSAPANDDNAAQVYNHHATGRDDLAPTLGRPDPRLSALAASATLKAYYRASGAARVTAAGRWLTVTPVLLS